VIAAEGKFEARFVDQAFPCRCRADSNAETPQEVLRELEIPARKNLVNLLIEGQKIKERS